MPLSIHLHYEKQKVWSRTRSQAHTCALTHDANKDVPEDERSNTEPQDDVNLDGNGIWHLDEISEDVVPVVQSEKLKQSHKSIAKCAAILPWNEYHLPINRKLGLAWMQLTKFLTIICK